MVICKFYREGRCKFGDNCRYEHIDPPSHSHNTAADPFAGPAVANGPRTSMQQGRPEWPLSVVALPNPSAGNALTGDISAEELRVQAYAAAPRGRSEAIAQRETAMVSEHKVREAALAPANVPDPFTGPAQAQPFAMTPAQAPQDPFANAGGGFGRAQHQQQQQPENMFAAPVPQFAQTTPSPFGQASQPFNGASMNAATMTPATTMSVAQTTTPISTEAEGQYSAMQFGFRKVPEQAPPPRFY